MKRDTVSLSANLFHNLLCPVIVLCIWTASNSLDMLIAAIITAVSIVSSVKVGIVFRVHISAATPAFVTYAEICQIEGLFPTVSLAKLCHGRYSVEGHIFNPFAHFLNSTRTDVTVYVSVTAKLLAKLEALEKANEERDKKASRAATIEAVRKGLKDKFDKAKLELNDFFLDTAISKLEIPDKDADVIDLVSKAESIYTTDFKRATGNTAIPHKGSGSSSGGGKTIRDDEWDDIIEPKGK